MCAYDSLHVGCGAKHKDLTTRGFNTPEWHELRLDIDPSGRRHDKKIQK